MASLAAINNARVKVLNAFAQDGAEHLDIVDATTNAAIHAATYSLGSRNQTSIPPAVMQLLLVANAKYCTVHNHPRGRSLGRDDLQVLLYGGVKWVEAVMADSGWFRASRGSRTLSSAVLNKAGRELTKMRHALLTTGIAALGDAEEHVMCLALNKAKYIEYDFYFSPARQREYLSMLTDMNLLATTLSGSI
jgi:hypothetical protein